LIYVTVDYSAQIENWSLKTLERIIKGLKGLEREGFKVEQYTEFEDRQPMKRILAISRPDSIKDDALHI